MLQAAINKYQPNEALSSAKAWTNTRNAVARTLNGTRRLTSVLDIRQQTLPARQKVAEVLVEKPTQNSPTVREMAGCDIESGMPLDISAIRAIRDTYAKLLAMPKDVQEQIFSFKMEGYLLGHSTRVAIYAALLAQKLNEDAGEEEKIDPALAATAGFLHDLGKMQERQKAISEIRGKLTDLQYKEMKEHPEHGARALEELREYEGGKYLPIDPKDYRAVVSAILNHHVRPDGNNRSYPKFVNPDETGMLDRIISVADSFDAMASNRSYNANRGDMQAQIEHGRNEVAKWAGTQFDPMAAKAFCGISPTPKFHETEELMAA